MLATPSLAQLRMLSEAQGVTPSDEDLEAVRAFLEVVLPAFDEMERMIPPGAAPAGPEDE
jgi:hypothetical protein